MAIVIGFISFVRYVCCDLSKGTGPVFLKFAIGSQHLRQGQSSRSKPRPVSHSRFSQTPADSVLSRRQPILTLIKPPKNLQAIASRKTHSTKVEV